jgi:hypothetical protein
MVRARMPAFNVIMLLAVAVLVLGAPAAMAGGTSDLVFSGDGSFHGAHGGQPIHVAVVSADDGKVVATQSGTVSKTADPSFSFTFPGVLENGKTYEVDYWIDSNFGGGTVGVCDPKAHDHQWKVPLGTVSGSVALREKHRPAETSDVCETFK